MDGGKAMLGHVVRLCFNSNLPGPYYPLPWRIFLGNLLTAKSTPTLSAVDTTRTRDHMLVFYIGLSFILYC